MNEIAHSGGTVAANRGQQATTLVPTALSRFALTPPELATIRLGVKGPKGNPVDTDHFVLPHDAQGNLTQWGRAISAVYGDKPKQLEVVFPASFFVRHYAVFSASEEARKRGMGGVIRCHSADGVTARLRDKATGLFSERPCPKNGIGSPPCEHESKCRQRGRISFFLPRVSQAGVFVLGTGSEIGMDNLAGAMVDAIQRLGQQHFHQVVWVLSREEKAVSFQGKVTAKHILKLRLHPGVDDVVRRLYTQNNPFLAALEGAGHEHVESGAVAGGGEPRAITAPAETAVQAKTHEHAMREKHAMRLRQAMTTYMDALHLEPGACALQVFQWIYVYWPSEEGRRTVNELSAESLSLICEAIEQTPGGWPWHTPEPDDVIDMPQAPETVEEAIEEETGIGLEF